MNENQNGIITKGLFVLCLIFLFSFQLMPSCKADYPSLTQSFENNGWLIEYSFSNSRGEPNDKIIFEIKITPKIKIYDFRVWVESTHLDVSSKYQKSNLYYETLLAGDVIEDSLEITIPRNAEYGEKYSVEIIVESHSNPSSGGIRIFDNPEHQYNNQENNQPFWVSVEAYPILKIESAWNVLQEGQFNEYSISISNSGNGDANNVYYKIEFPSTFEIVGNLEGQILVITAKSKQAISFEINPKEKGEYAANVSIVASNHGEIKDAVNLQVEDFNIYLYLMIGVFFVLVIIVRGIIINIRNS